MYKWILIGSVAAAPFTGYMSLYITGIALVALWAERRWERVGATQEETDQ